MRESRKGQRAQSLVLSSGPVHNRAHTLMQKLHKELRSLKAKDSRINCKII